MKILIVDNEKPARDRLTHMIESLPNYQVVGQASNAKEAIALATSTKPDIVLMDISLPAMDGIQAGRYLSAMLQPPAVIFTSASPDHALDAFEIHAVDYLLKPIKEERLRAAIEAAIKPNKAQVLRASPLQSNHPLGDIEPRQHICARVRGSLVLVPIDNVYYFNANQKYVTVCHTGGEVLIEDSLKALEIEFADRFYRIHRNALVSLSHVSGLKSHNAGHQVTFHDVDDTLEVSRRHLARVRKKMKNRSAHL
jgi:two-component system response regulator AlgR